MNSTGPISLAGATAGQSIEIAVSNTSSGTISLNDYKVRNLAGVSSGTIAMPTNFYGKAYALPFNGFGSATPFPSAWSGYTLNGLAVNSSGTYVAVLDKFNVSPPSVSTSTDGVTWGTVTAMGSATSVMIMGAIAPTAAGGFVSVGFNFSSNLPLFSYSSNGTTWATPAVMGGTTQISNPVAVVCGTTGTTCVAVGNNISSSTGLPTDPVVYYSTNSGSTWSGPTILGSAGSGITMTGVSVNSSGLFVAVGYGSSYQPYYATSTNGTTWSAFSTMGGSTSNYRINAIAVNPSGLFVAVGVSNYGSSPNYPIYATSSNGTTWSVPTTIGSTTGLGLGSIACNVGGTFVAAGNSQASSAIYTSSIDGSTWVTPTAISGSTSNIPLIVSNSSGTFTAANSTAFYTSN